MIERQLTDFEKTVTLFATIPIVGTIPAALKILVGIIQVVAALIIALFAGIFAPFSRRAKDLCVRAASHIVHGFANIIAGSIEAIPLVSFINWTVRSEILRYRNLNFIRYKHGETENERAYRHTNPPLPYVIYI